MKTVLFYGNSDSLSGLWLEGIKRKDGKIVGGSVINGMWDFRIKDDKFLVGEVQAGRFVCFTEYSLPEKMIEIQVDIKSYDYNEVIEAARQKL